MAGSQPTERIYLKDSEGKLVDLAAVWKQAKGQLTGKVKVSQELADLFRVGNEIPLISFPNQPKAKVQTKGNTPF